MRTLLKYFYYRTLNSAVIRAWLGHSLGIVTHFRWKIFHKYCIRQYPKRVKINDVYLSVSEELRKTGGAIIGFLDVSEITRDVRSTFDELGAPHNSIAVKLPKDILEKKFLYPIYELMTQIAPAIESYYQSYFNIYFINIERNRPGAVLLDTSFGWHIDDNPREIMKVFIYLNDVRRDNGAFRAFDYSHSRTLISRGFISNESASRLSHQSMVSDYIRRVPNALRVYEGSAGLALMFDNNLVHKATAPETGERLVIQIQVHPSAKRFGLESVKNALCPDLLMDFPQNPYDYEAI